MDWQGQKLAELLMQIVLAVSAFVAFGTGYFMASFKLMLIIYAGGVLITLLISVPDWPFFNRHPLQWLDPKNIDSQSSRAQKSQSNWCKLWAIISIVRPVLRTFDPMDGIDISEDLLRHKLPNKKLEGPLGMDFIIQLSLLKTAAMVNEFFKTKTNGVLLLFADTV